MPRAFGIKQLVSPNQGLVTEQSKLVPVEGSTVDELNFTYNDDGSIRQRRLGVNKEPNASFFTLNDTVNSTEYTAYTLWRAVGGDGSLNFHVFQIGNTLHFIKDAVGNLSDQLQSFSFNLDSAATTAIQSTGVHDGAAEASTLTDTTASFTVDALVGSTVFNTTDGSSGLVTANTSTTVTATLTGGTEDDWDVSDAYTISNTGVAPVSMTSGEGNLFIVSSVIEPFYLEYDAVGNTLTNIVVTLSIRDLTGVDDSLATDERPGSLSELHDYNLNNQGWWQTRRIVAAGSFVDPIAQFFTTNASYPSNADIALLGMVDDGSGNFVYDPDFLLELTLGNTPAPKGHFIIDPFSIEYEDLRTGTGGSGGYGVVPGFDGGSGGGGGSAFTPIWWIPAIPPILDLN